MDCASLEALDKETLIRLVLSQAETIAALTRQVEKAGCASKIDQAFLKTTRRYRRLEARARSGLEAVGVPWRVRPWIEVPHHHAHAASGHQGIMIQHQPANPATLRSISQVKRRHYEAIFQLK